MTSSTADLNADHFKHTTLVVDLDGTLTPCDTLVESVIALVKRHPLNLFLIPLWLLKGRAAFKTKVASRAHFSVDNMPLRTELMDYLVSQKSMGRRLVLATAAHESIAQAMARRTGLFDDVLASDAEHNLKGRHKLAAIQRHIGNDFAYAGDSPADLPIWRAARAAVLVNVSPRIKQALDGLVSLEREFQYPAPTLRTWIKALRVHQWIKNVLVFVPLLTAFSFLDASSLVNAMIAFFAFSLTASATYVVNDLWDLDNDRTHPRKQKRPFASAALPIPTGLAVAGIALTIAFVLALYVSTAFTFMLLSYLVLTSAYSWVLKQYVLIDVFTLSLLYTLRILAGAVAIGVTTSPWLLAFSVFIFLSLALVKRCSELISLEHAGQTATHGRDYRVSDQQVLTPLGMASALGAIVVFGLYISSPEVQAHYASPVLLWLAALGMIYWLARLWIKTQRGEMHDDPIVFALHDRGSRIAVIAMVAVVLAAHYLTGIKL
ncbi:MAG TPA: UbiA family prenyltransferase [Thiobacillus sp.]